MDQQPTEATPERAATTRTGNRYDDLLVAAIELASLPRPVAIPSLRSVARACGVSATAVYRHFPSQSALTQAMMLSCDRSFTSAVAGADDTSRSPAERLRRISRAYLDWGLANPGLYQLRFESADRLGDDYVRTSAADELLAHIDGILAAQTGRADTGTGACTDTDIRTGDGAGRSSRATAHDLWIGMHGLVSLHIHKPDLPWPTDRDTEICRFLTFWGIID